MWRSLLTIAATGCQLVFPYEEPPPPTVDQLAAGRETSCWLTARGALTCWGLNNEGQTGTGRPEFDLVTPTEVAGTWVAVSIEHEHGCAIDQDHRLSCWGDNGLGAYGVTSMSSRIPIPTVAGHWNSVAAGESYTCAVDRDGVLSCWGSSREVLADAPTPAPPTPIASSTASRWKTVRSGAQHACAIDDNDGLYCWGRNSDGQVGINSTAPTVPHPDLAIEANGRRRWITVAPGITHTCAIADDHTLWCWGDNSHGQLGNTTTTPSQVPVTVEGGPWHAVTTGTNHTCAANDRGVACWGDGSRGQLAITVASDATEPMQVAGGQAIQLAAGFAHTCVFGDGAVVCSGLNGSGQLGDGAGGSRLQPVAIAGKFSEPADAGAGNACARRAQADQQGGVGIACWGDGDRHQLDRSPSSSVPITLRDAALSDRAISVGDHHTCVVTQAFTLSCWGDNSERQVADSAAESLPATDSSTVAIVGVSAAHHTCIINSVGGVQCWGDNSNGECATRNNPQPPFGEVILTDAMTNAAAGHHHGCATLGNGILCWGRNNLGQVLAAPSDQVLQASFVQGLPGVVAWSRLAAAGDHTCALSDAKKLVCWGRNNEGQLADPGADNHLVTVGELWNDVSVGALHTCGVRAADNSLWCWGDNSYGQLGTGERSGRSQPIQPIDTAGLSWARVLAGDEFSCAITTGQQLMCWGRNHRGQIGDGTAWRVGFAPIVVD